MTDLENIDQLANEAIQAMRRYLESEVARLVGLLNSEEAKTKSNRQSGRS